MMRQLLLALVTTLLILPAGLKAQEYAHEGDVLFSLLGLNAEDEFVARTLDLLGYQGTTIPEDGIVDFTDHYIRFEFDSLNMLQRIVLYRNFMNSQRYDDGMPAGLDWDVDKQTIEAAILLKKDVPIDDLKDGYDRWRAPYYHYWIEIQFAGQLMETISLIPRSDMVLYNYGECIEGNCMTGKGKMQWSDGTVAEGSWMMGYLHGKGEVTYSNGTYYSGDFRFGLFEGTGEAYSPDGKHYIGDFVAGKRHGQGTLQIDAEKTYQGEFKNDVMDGYGTLTNGEISYEGEVYNALFHGEGTISDVEKTVTGRFWYGDPDGEVTYRYKDGTVIIKQYDKGELLSEEAQ